MPRKASKLTAIPVDEPVAESSGTDEKTEAQEMTEVIAQVAETTLPTVEEAPAKKRATRSPRVKKDTITTVWESKTDDDGKPSTRDEQRCSTSPEVTGQAPPSEKVACEHCGKVMSAKTLK